MEKKTGGRNPAPRASESAKQDAAGSKATQFDGNPNPQGAPSDTFKPKDDTPMTLEKKKNPRPNPE